ncbi:MAG: carboxypeptidase-like regulatory domain-containing protein, partial [Bacteroidetes bacterium]|nr:carboxypeptidase-like regulatory domain-containing protein [Bacteroidota bacterium]
MALLVALLFGAQGLASAQTMVSGKVTDTRDGSELPGASVLVKGTNIGTQTDVNGSYQISAPENAVLVFSFVGKISKEVAVGNQT